jgi:hypothetical protein
LAIEWESRLVSFGQIQLLGEGLEFVVVFFVDVVLFDARSSASEADDSHCTRMLEIRSFCA